ncbi:hypothetical protein A3J43_00055 [Candidatus Uhrbacteria bacterium RIFCSPHIGHO2_12_FULL_54_23]|uniref:Uncharacterized protein n=2 Tax=Candidatus Uhriibacteriota TaxID=1752732 RepID=A0A1F7UFY2_9BACT|nr:MAG: hypothetical protein A3J43_00055 [Candidatus Uhrbacteria bacterium RIFCSPHIGHO2_12_FULL_54_23]OGL90094.1 MAG: hypothetical protein A3J36_01440 [Candidatus Uhrbacteria bacterium RIFCSPLOWO2_02_FULL_54_37]
MPPPLPVQVVPACSGDSLISKPCVDCKVAVWPFDMSNSKLESLTVNELALLPDITVSWRPLLGI